MRLRFEAFRGRQVLKIVSKPASVMGCRLFRNARGLSTGMDIREIGRAELPIFTYIMRSLTAEE